MAPPSPHRCRQPSLFLAGLLFGLGASFRVRTRPPGPAHLSQSGNPAFDPATDAVRLPSVLACGDACTYGKADAWTPSQGQCTQAWLRLASSCPATDWPPPRSPSGELAPSFTMDGRIPMETWYFNDTRYSGHAAKQAVWDAAVLDAAITAPDFTSMARHVKPNYGHHTAAYVDHALTKYRSAVDGKVGVVWGSETPWAEVMLARAGAAHVTTLDYGRIVSQHARFTPATPPALAAMMLTTPRTWDFVFAYSSLEHSGLGRYGDALNPYGDMEAAVQTWCLLKPGGLFFLGVPCMDTACEQDVLVWNAHRLYGTLRLREMSAGYDLVEVVRSPYMTPRVAVIHVLRKRVIA